MVKDNSRKVIRKRKHLRVRKKVSGDAERPRLNVYRSLNHIYAQLINDTEGRTIAAASSLELCNTEKDLPTGGNIEAAKKVGEILAQKAQANGIRKVVFDRGGNIYHGRIKALAEAARKAGLEF